MKGTIAEYSFLYTVWRILHCHLIYAKCMRYQEQVQVGKVVAKISLSRANHL